MDIGRRTFLAILASDATARALRPGPERVADRHALVVRHNPRLRAADPRAPLSVGNGEFAFTADVTGLQTFPELYENSIPLCTQSQWGWHTTPIPAGLDPGKLRLEMYDTYGRPVGYPTSARGQEQLYTWLRENPHRLNLARIGFEGVGLSDIAAVEQELDLWTGTLHSRFELRGSPVSVWTCCHPERDALAVGVRSPWSKTAGFPSPCGFPMARRP